MVKVIHALPDWSWRQTIPGHGAWKDIMGRLCLWKEVGCEAEIVDVDVHRPESLLDRLTSEVQCLAFDYTHWPELLEAARSRVPGLRAVVRAHNAEALQHWHSRLDSRKGLHGRAQLVWRTLLASRRDRRILDVADFVLGISAWDNRHYWRRLRGRARILDSPYFCPWPDLGQPASVTPWTLRRKAIACMPAGRSPIEKAQVAAFVRFASDSRQLEGPGGHQMLLTNALWSEYPDSDVGPDVKALGDVGDPWGFMQGVRAVALLSDRGFGAKTTVYDAIEAGCHVLVEEALARRLPREVRERCLVLRVGDWPQSEIVLAALERAPAPTDLNLRLRERSKAALKEALFAPAGASRGILAVPGRLRPAAARAGSREEVRVFEPGEGLRRRPTAPANAGQSRQKPWTRGGAAILMYHGIVPRKRDVVLDRYAINEETLRDHLRYLKRSRVPVALKTLVEAIRTEGRVDPRWIVVTLDDGLRSQTSRGAEILDSEGVPWSLCVPAGLVGSPRSIWSYELALLILECWEEDEIELPGGEVVPVGGRHSREHALRTIRSRLQPSPGGRNPVTYVDGLRERFGPDRFEARLAEDGRFTLASWKEVRALHATGVTILAHGFHHLPHHDALDEDARKRETNAARERLVGDLGECSGFALPHGVRAAWTGDSLAEAGYGVNLTSRPGPVGPGADLLDLPRLDADMPLADLEQQLVASL